MDTYLQLSPDSSTPHTPSPRSSLDLEDMNSQSQAFQDAGKQQPEAVEYSYERDEHLDHSRNPDQPTFWNQNDPMANPPRGYLSELYDDRMKLDGSHPENELARDHGPSPLPCHTSPSPHMWDGSQESEQDQHYYRRASYPQARHEDPMHPGSHYLHSEPGAFLGPFSNRSDVFYGEPMSMPEHVCIPFLRSYN